MTATNRRFEHMGCTGNSRRREGMRKKIAVGATVAVALALLFLYPALSFSSDSASAESWPKAVDGHVYDLSSAPVVGATVVVEIWDGATLRYTAPSETTDSGGFYLTDIAGASWFEGDTIKVTASYDSKEKSESVTADGSDGQTVDITFPYAIPQLAGMAGTLITVAAIGVLAMVLLRRNGQNRKSS
jgi:hypothetical protein